MWWPFRKKKKPPSIRQRLRAWMAVRAWLTTKGGMTSFTKCHVPPHVYHGLLNEMWGNERLIAPGSDGTGFMFDGVQIVRDNSVVDDFNAR